MRNPAKFFSYTISYQFNFTKWSELEWSKTIAYWQAHRFLCEVTPSLGIKGKRGNLWGNLTSFDMTKLMCTLAIAHSQPGIISSTFELNAFGQDLTEWNITDFKLEHLLFRRELLELAEPDILTRYRTDRRKANVDWSLSGMTLGRKLSSEWTQLLNELADGTVEPTIRRAV